MAADPFGIYRARADAAVQRAERNIFAAAWDLMKRWGSRLRGVLLGPSGVVTPTAVYSTEQWFAHELDDVIVTIHETVDWAAHDVHDDPIPDTFAGDYLERARNRLVRIPDSVYSVVNRMTMEAHTEGWGIDELAQHIDALLIESGSDRWRNRAQTIARTEAVGAYNAGTFKGFRSLATSLGGPWEKGWLATEDERTRPTHVRADLQRVPLLEPFRVGGFPGMHPGDPMLPAQEVINCRCSMLLLRPDEQINYADRQSRARS